MKVVFRTDASGLIGTGHVMRCLNLASALRKRDGDSLFLCRDHAGNLVPLIRERGFEVRVLGEGVSGNSSAIGDTPSAADSSRSRLGAGWLTDAEETIRVVTEWGRPDWMIVDHYGIDFQWERMVRPYSRGLMVIDDLADRAHDCDLLVDQNLVANPRSRYGGKLPEHCCLLVGPRYAMLAPRYAELHGHVAPRHGKIHRVLVYFGGADIENITGKTISAFLTLGRKDVEMDVVVNPQSPHVESIRRQIAGVGNVRLHMFLPSLSGLMSLADVSIGAGGITTWERCCLGVPSYVITLADNQIAGAMELDRLGVICWLGNASDMSLRDLTDAISDMLEKSSHIDFSRRGLDLVDGLGSIRIADYLTAGCDSRLRVRPASPDDEELILRWANDPVVRDNSFSPGLIDAAVHHQWFRRRLANRASCCVFVVETEAGLPVGQVRFELSNEVWEVHYALDACMRGRGMGGVFLKAALSEFLTQVPSCTEIVGRVKSGNLASQKVFKRLGFVEETDGSHLFYRLSL